MSTLLTLRDYVEENDLFLNQKPEQTYLINMKGGHRPQSYLVVQYDGNVSQFEADIVSLGMEPDLIEQIASIQFFYNPNTIYDFEGIKASTLLRVTRKGPYISETDNSLTEYIAEAMRLEIHGFAGLIGGEEEWALSNGLGEGAKYQSVYINMIPKEERFY